jgi:hypothetical protein
MRDEVEEFLKRVAQMRQQAEAQAKAQQQRPKPTQPAAPPAQQRAVPPPRPAPPQRLVPPPQDIKYVEPVEVVEAELSDRTEGFNRRVAHDLRGSEEIAQHTRQLGAEVDLADDKLAAHLHQTFDHELGRLKKTASETAAIAHASPSSDVTVSELLQALRSPESIRDAIIMAEVLRRPEDRW